MKYTGSANPNKIRYWEPSRHGTVTLIGATTENPSFEVIRPLLSRCQALHTEIVDWQKEDLLELLQRAITTDSSAERTEISKLKETGAMLRFSGGDARKLLNITGTRW